MGSSPLTRGKRHPQEAGHRLCGLIPAHAGKTDHRTVARLPVGAHPRSRGENDDTGGESRVIGGSSPLTRGKPNVVQEGAHALGLIPAHAGKTQCSSARLSAWPAHPRSRGENAVENASPTGRVGSSPLTRGKLSIKAWAIAGLGLIPAHAGKT